VAVFAPVNSDEPAIPGAYLTLGAPPHQHRFDISTSWGQSAKLEPIAKKLNPVRVHIVFPENYEFSPNGHVGKLFIDMTPKEN